MSKKILFIEDEFSLQKTLSQMLQTNGYTVISSLEGKGGVNLAKREKPDLIILDLILPKMNGFEVLEELKKDEETKDIPVIVLTNLEDNQSIEKVLSYNVLHYFVKSNFTPHEIVEKINAFFK
ncbi:MAG: response regulator [Minisyncoccia bacterium]